MVRYSRKRNYQRKRRSPRRPLRRRRFYGKRSIPRRTRRYSRYPRRVAGPGVPVKRFSRSNDWQQSGSDTFAFQVEKDVPFDTYVDNTDPANPVTVTGVRQYATHKIKFPDAGDDTWTRRGNRFFVHGIRFTMKLWTMWSANPSWQNGEIHFALVQARDSNSFISPSSLQPTFSAPIGEPSNDDGRTVSFTDHSIMRPDAIKGKLRNTDYNVITHRKFYATKKLSTENRWFTKDIQFYLPIKKSFAFLDSLHDDYSTKPLYVMLWYVPHSNKHEALGLPADQRYLTVDNFRYSIYFKNTQ
jgi:hypothetical protein